MAGALVKPLLKVGRHSCLQCNDVPEVITLMPRPVISPAKPRYCRWPLAGFPGKCGQQQ